MKDSQEHQVPQWLSIDYLLKVLQPIVKESKVVFELLKILFRYTICHFFFKIISSSTDVVSTTGDSFSSPIFRVKICASAKNEDPVEHSFIVKIPSPSRPLNEDVSFDNEIRFYNSTLSEMHRMLKHSGNNIELGPRVFHYSSGENAVIILEDLSAQFYEQPIQLLQLDETLSALYKLSKWHATSIFMSKDVRIV